MVNVVPTSVLVYVVAWFAFECKAVCVAVDIGFAESLVLSTLAELTIALENPGTIPVNVGLLNGALYAKLLSVSVLVYVVDWFALNAELRSTSVSVYVVDSTSFNAKLSSTSVFVHVVGWFDVVDLSAFN